MSQNVRKTQIVGRWKFIGTSQYRVNRGKHGQKYKSNLGFKSTVDMSKRERTKDRLEISGEKRERTKVKQGKTKNSQLHRNCT